MKNLERFGWLVSTIALITTLILTNIRVTELKKEIYKLQRIDALTFIIMKEMHPTLKFRPKNKTYDTSKVSGEIWSTHVDIVMILKN